MIKKMDVSTGTWSKSGEGLPVPLGLRGGWEPAFWGLRAEWGNPKSVKGQQAL